MYIYKIFSKNKDDPNVYIGSTKNFKKRMNQHKSDCNNEKSHCHNLFLYNYIRSHGGWDSFDSEIIYEFECEDNKQKLQIEQEYINRYSFGLNSLKAFSTVDEINEYQKEYREDNKEKLAEQKKEYYKSNKEKIKQYQKEYNETNKEKIAARKKIKFTCECGSTLRKGEKARHKKTSKHIKYIEENNIII